MIPSIRHYGRILSVLSLFLPIVTPLSGETTGPAEGIVRFKISADHSDPGSIDRIAAEARHFLGTVEVQPWLDPSVLAYSGRRFYLYRLGVPKLGTRELPHASLARIMTMRYRADVAPEKAATLLETIQGVEYAETITYPTPAYTPNDPAVISTQQWHHGVIKSLGAWDVARGKSSIVVAIVDTGLEPEHEDLAAAIWTNPGESGDKKNNGIDDDGNGLIDDWWGWDFGGNDGKSQDNDPRTVNDSHGTHVGGIAGAVGNNGLGGAGVAWGVQIMAVKAGSDAYKPPLIGGYDGVLYAAAMGADIINCSWGAPDSFSRAEQELVTYVRQNLGKIIVGAAGNNGRNESYYPASYDNVISVASTRDNDKKAGSSDFHHTVDLVAPGEFVWSTYAPDSYGVESGTSMAAPMVSAAAALLMGHDPSLSPEEIEEAIIATTDNVDLLNSQYIGLLGSGRLNVNRAMTKYRTTTSAKIVNTRVLDGDNDGFIERGETVRLEFDVRNVLAAAENVSVSVEPQTIGTVTVTPADVALGAIARGATVTTPSTAFNLTFPDPTGDDTRISLWVTVSTQDHVSRTLLELTIFQTWGTTDLNDITATFNGVGNIAYNGMDKDQGEGFYFGGDGSLIWHGGLLLGTDADHLADVVRRGTISLGTDQGFTMISPYRTERTDEGSIEVGRARFRDREELGIEVAMTTWEFLEDPDFLLVSYELQNVGSTDVSGLFTGLYVDWDLLRDGGFDQASLDQDFRLGFMRNSTKPELTTGITLLSDQPLNYTAVNNRDDGIQTEFSDELKWTMLSSGLYRETSQIDIDASMMIGAGPIAIAPGNSETVTFAYVLATDHLGLRDAATRAGEHWDRISGVPDVAEVGRIRLYPQPTGRFATVEIPDGGFGTGSVRLYDPLGRLVMTREFRGESRITLDLAPLASGLYRVGVERNGEIVYSSIIVER